MNLLKARVPTVLTLLARWMGAALGVWLMAAPVPLNYLGTTAADNDRIIGPLVVTFSLVAAWSVTGSVRWANLPLAAWMLVGPWILGFPLAARINGPAVAVLLVIVTLVPSGPVARFGGGWKVLWRGATPAHGAV